MRPSRLLFEELKQWLNIATPPARTVVRKILKESPEPLHTHEIFLRSQRDFPLTQQEEEQQRITYARLLRRTGPPPPPNALHYIRSINYLKHVVLPDLEKRNEVAKIQRRRPPTPEERVIAATLKPPTLSQRKRRGAVGPGKQPTRLTSGEVREWVWRLKTAEDFEREARRREVEREKKERAQKEREAERLRRNVSRGRKTR